MNISTEDMKSCIQEWFAQAYSFEDLAEIFMLLNPKQTNSLFI